MKSLFASPGARLAACFFTYFAMSGLLAPFMPLYFQSRGLSAAEVGMVMALAQGLRVVGSNFWGWMADRTHPRTKVLRLTAIAIAVSFAGFLAPGGFGWIVVVMFFLHFFMTAQMPVAEALAMARLRGDPAAYGRLRVWGSVGYVVVVVGAGLLFDAAGIQWAPVLGLVLAGMMVMSAFGVRDEAVVQPDAKAGPSMRQRLRQPAVRWFLVSAALMVFAHGAFYSYFSLYLARLGYSKSVIGGFWMVGILFEILIFYGQGRLFARFSVYQLLSACFLLAALRFVMVAELAAFWWMILASQVLHAATFALHHSASVYLMQRWFSGRSASSGQALYVSISYGVGGTAGALVAAWVWAAISPQAAFLQAAGVALVGWVALRRAQAHDAGARQPHRIAVENEA